MLLHHLYMHILQLKVAGFHWDTEVYLSNFPPVGGSSGIFLKEEACLLSEEWYVFWNRQKKKLGYYLVIISKIWSPNHISNCILTKPLQLFF